MSLFWVGVLFGATCCAPVIYQIGYGRGMDLVWVNILERPPLRDLAPESEQ